MPDEFTHRVHPKQHIVSDTHHELIHQELTRLFHAMVGLNAAYRLAGVSKSTFERTEDRTGCLVCGKPVKDILHTGLVF